MIFPHSDDSLYYLVMTYQIYSSLLVVVLGLLVSLALVGCHRNSDDDIVKKRINERVFAISGKRLTPSETFELLQLLDRFYTYLATGDKNKEEQKRVKFLIMMGDTRRVHCGYMDLSAYDSLIKTSSEDKLINIVEYLRHFKYQAFLSCKNVLKELHEIEKEIDEEEEEERKFVALRESIRSANGDILKRQDPPYSREALNKGIESSLESMIGDIDNHRVGEGSKQQVVTKLCRSFQKRHRFSSRMFAQIINDFEPLIEQLEPDLFEALVDFKICHDIESGQMTTAGKNERTSKA